MRARRVLEWMMRAWGLLYTEDEEGVKRNHESNRERHERGATTKETTPWAKAAGLIIRSRLKPAEMQF